MRAYHAAVRVTTADGREHTLTLSSADDMAHAVASALAQGLREGGLRVMVFRWRAISRPTAETFDDEGTETWQHDLDDDMPW